MSFREYAQKNMAQEWSYDVAVDYPEGWADLVEQMHEAILVIDPNYKVQQVKQKFGGLRFYIKVSEFVRENDVFWNEIYRIIEFYEAKSYQVCQDCGGKGELERNSRGEFRWVLTLCNKCRRKRNRQ